jgi:hypothetical protein
MDEGRYCYPSIKLRNVTEYREDTNLSPDSTKSRGEKGELGDEATRLK